MKTIAITIDAHTLERIDCLVAGRADWKSRSQVIRKAAQQFVARVDRATEEAREREIVRRHRARLNRDAAALVREQARP